MPHFFEYTIHEAPKREEIDDEEFLCVDKREDSL